MKGIYLALVLCPQFALAGETVNGAWRGSYTYEDGRAPVSFEMKLCQEGSRIRGGVTEPGAGGEGMRAARIEGSVVNGVVTFRKTYDGTGGFTHAVEYEGKTEKGRMSGSWTIPPGLSGAFEVTREAGPENSAGCTEQPVMILRAL